MKYKDLKEIQSKLKKKGKVLTIKEVKEEVNKFHKDMKKGDKEEKKKEKQVNEIIIIVQRALLKHKVKLEVIWDISILVESLKSLSHIPDELFVVEKK